MLQSPLQRLARYPEENLRRFSYHTGAPLRALDRDEVCPILFRDLGTQATALYLRGQLKRLAGPLSPVTYLRTADYIEPYTDHGLIGRLIFLQPLDMAPWHSGIDPIYVSAGSRRPETWSAVGFVPGHIGLHEAAREAAIMTDRLELREAFGGNEYDDALADTLARIDLLDAALASTDLLADPLRRCLKSPDGDLKARARALMAEAGLSESDLCTAWHHLPGARRALIGDTLQRCAVPITALAGGRP